MPSPRLAASQNRLDADQFAEAQGLLARTNTEVQEMFGSKRRKATAAAVEAIRPILAIGQQWHGIPSHFWSDLSVLGFFGTLIGFFANLATNGTLSQKDKDLVLYDALTTLSNMNGQELGRDFTRLVLSNPKDTDFERGADAAVVCASYSIGKTGPLAQPCIDRAERTVAEAGMRKTRQNVFAVIVQQAFYGKLEERFGTNSQTHDLFCAPASLQKCALRLASEDVV